MNPAGGNVCTSECQTGSEDEELKQSAGAMYEPENLALDSHGQVFVADARNNRIDVFSAGGSFVRAFGKDVEAGPGTGSVCTLVTGCERGVPDGSAGAAVEENGGFARIERFGEPGTPAPSSCPASNVNPPPPPPPLPPQRPSPGPAPAKPSSLFKLGKLKLNKARGTATLTVEVPGPGALVLKGRGLKKVTRVAKKASSVKLLVGLAGKAKKKLSKTGTAKLKAKLTFTPSGAAALTKPRSLVLKETLRH